MKESKTPDYRDTEILLDKPWMRVLREKVRFPDGTMVNDFYTVERPAYVAIIPLWPNGDILLVRQYRHGPRKKILNIPMGTVGKNEKPIRAAQRELQEETGYRAKELLPVGVFENNPAFLRLTCHLFLARRLEKRKPRHRDKMESTTLIRIPLSKALLKIFNGEMKDMTTAVGILAAVVRGRI